MRFARRKKSEIAWLEYAGRVEQELWLAFDRCVDFGVALSQEGPGADLRNDAHQAAVARYEEVGSQLGEWRRSVPHFKRVRPALATTHRIVTHAIARQALALQYFLVALSSAPFERDEIAQQELLRVADASAEVFRTNAAYFGRVDVERPEATVWAQEEEDHLRGAAESLRQHLTLIEAWERRLSQRELPA